MNISAETVNMSAEDVQLPSIKILYALESKSISFCCTNQWCYRCGLSEHHTHSCEHTCPDCVSTTPHFFHKCPELHQYMLTTDFNNQRWYNDISQHIRQEFDGNPRMHNSNFKKVGVILCSFFKN